jgi:hypothetical protein
MQPGRIAQAGRNAQKPSEGLVDCFSQLAVTLQRSINLSDQAAKEGMIDHWHRMQSLGNTFQLAVAFQPTPVKRFSGGPVNSITDSHSKLVFDLR